MQKEHFRRFARDMLYITALAVLGWAFTDYKTIFTGYILGIITSFYCIWILHRKINTFFDRVLKQQKVRSLGTVICLSAVALAMVIALRYDDFVNIPALTVGLMTGHLVIMINFALQHTSFARKRGE